MVRWWIERRKKELRKAAEGGRVVVLTIDLGTGLCQNTTRLRCWKYLEVFLHYYLITTLLGAVRYVVQTSTMNLGTFAGSLWHVWLGSQSGDAVRLLERLP